ncbi:RNA polymerase sigma factor [Chitinophaga niabensis]|uniref:RNA polymerase sigma-70 factor, ECF subfamily n=1 Tax=Chitinophaga niabensis TaxID=536979 RepID=A0A1N6DC99_9BACT|nr:sigma-70 family RNA polymerase sigma factor [Chitinophaga niabensis]SIN68409.1 RNA polymerase sigma-70 factor, ECF subfamily [Chitinophaga niabensis]
MSSNQPYSEKDLFLRIAEGNETAFATLFNLYSTPLATIALRMLHSGPAKQEVMQEVFIKLWLNRDRLKEVQHPGAWLRKITIHECLQYLRKTSLYNSKLESLEPEGTSFNHALHAISVKEIQLAVKQALEVMPSQRRAIYELSRGKGMATKEIAAQLGLSDGYVRNAISAALSTIRSFLPDSLQLPAIIFLLFF